MLKRNNYLFIFLFTGMVNTLQAQSKFCTIFPNQTKGCEACSRANMLPDKLDEVKFIWTPLEDGIILQNDGAVVELLVSQPGVDVMSATKPDGKFHQSVAWFPFDETNRFVHPVFQGTDKYLLNVGPLGYSYKNANISNDVPLVVLKVTVNLAAYDWKTNQAGSFSPSTQCLLVFNSGRSN